MARLPLYTEKPRLAVEVEQPLDLDSSCRRCKLGGTNKATCLPADGEAGGLFVVTDAPGREEESAGRPLAGRSGVWLRQQIGKLWAGPVAYDFGVRCVPNAKTSALDVVDDCRPYLAQTLREVKPQRVVCFGTTALAAVLGRSVTPLDTLRGYAWLTSDSSPVPVFFMPSPVIPMRNRLMRQFWFEPALKAALQDAPPVPASALDAEYEVVPTARVADVLAYCTAADFTSVDLEWSGHPFDAAHRIVSVAVTPVVGDEMHTFVFGAQQLADAGTVALLKSWWQDPAAKKVGSNLKADVVAFRSAYGVMLAGQVGDTRFMRRLLESDASAKLETMAELVGMGGHKQEMEDAGAAAVKTVRLLANKRLPPKDIVREIERQHGYTGVLPQHIERVLQGDNPKTYRMAFVEPTLMQRYNARDTVTTALLHKLLRSRLESDDADLERVWRELVLPVAWCLGYVESWGMPVDRAALANFGAYLQAELDIVAKRFEPYGYNPKNPDGFNPNSSASVADLLFKQLGIQPTHFTDTGKPATHAEALEDYAKQHAVANDLLRWRRLAKLKGTYADGDDGEGGLLTHVRDDSRIHPSINPDGTRTGRASSSGPNLQNIPRADTVEGKMLRDCFVAPDGWVFVELDHSQLELRITADQCGDENMLGIFHSGEDYHLRTAKLLAPQLSPGIDPNSLTADSPERTGAKGINFGVIYDDSPYGLAFRLGVPVEKAIKLRDALFGKFKKLPKYIEDRVQETARNGTARTWWNGGPARRRWLMAVADVDEAARKTARRGSWNTPIQGTGSDYLAAGMVEVVRWILEEDVPAQVCVPIHDAILALVREDVLEEYLYVVPRLMTGFPTKSGVPLVVDAKVGKTWGSMKKRKLA